MDAKAGLPEAEPPNPWSTGETLGTKSTAWRRYVSFITKTTGLITILYLASTYWLHDAHELQNKPMSYEIDKHSEDPNLNFTKRELLHFDIELPPGVPDDRSIGIHESLDWCKYSWNATGTLRIVRGGPEQRYNFMVAIDASASSRMALDSVIWPFETDSTNAKTRWLIRCVDFPGEDFRSEWDAHVRVDVTVFFKPHSWSAGFFYTPPISNWRKGWNT